MTSSAAPNDPSHPVAALTVGRIHAGMESNLAPMISQLLRVIRDLSGKAENISVGDIAEFINGEPTILARIVTIASSVGYNTGGIEVTSVHQAISLIGFDRVRTLAISILLLESAHSESAAESNRELAGTALISGLVAAEMCRRKVSADAEMAFICGALRNYGRILASTFLPREYAEMQKLSSRIGSEPAFQQVFGLDPLTLAHELMGHMPLPKAILHSLVRLSPVERKSCAAAATSALIGAADFGLRFAELFQLPDLDHSNFERRAENLSREYDLEFYLKRDEIRELLRHLVAMLECFRHRAGSYVGSVNTFRRLEALVAERVLPPVTKAVPVTPATPLPPQSQAIDHAEGFDI